MEIVIGVGIGIVIAALFGIRKKTKSMPYDPSQANAREETAEERNRRETDELITVVLPTINKDE